MKFERVLNSIIEYGFYALFFFVPLILNPLRNFPSYELFEWNKMIFVYFMAVAIVGAWVGRMIVHKKILFRRTPFDIPFLLFLVSQSLSTLFSIDPHVSIFGYYSRFHGGLLSTITYITLFYAYVTNSELIKFNRLIKFILTSGTIVTLYGIAERFGIDAHMWVQDVRSRVFSTLGQPNWLAAYVAILLPLSINKLLTFFQNTYIKQNAKTQNSNVKSQNDNSKIKNILRITCYLSLITLFYTCLLFTKSRSGFLGFWVANALFWIGIFYSSNVVRSFLNKNKEKFSLRSNNIIISFLILNFSFFIFNFFIKTPFPQYNRLLTIEVFDTLPSVEEKAPIGDSVINVGVTDSADIRRIVWQGARDIVKAYPLFGTGPETFAYAYYKYRPAAHNLTSEWDFLYNRAHNEFLNIAATSGLFGLGVYTLLILFVIGWTFKSLLRTPNSQLLTIALLSAYMSISVTNFFGFSVVVVGLYFFLIPAFIFTLNHPISSSSLPKTKFTTHQKIFLGLVGLGVFYGISQLVRLWVSDSLFARANGLTRQENYTEAYSHIVSATDLRPDEPLYHDERATIAGTLAAAAFETQNATLTAQLAEEAIDQSTLALKISPQNVNFWKTRTRIFYLLSTIKPEFIHEALEAISVAAQLAPTDAKIAYNMAVIQGHAGKNDQAILTLEKTIDLKPDYRDAYIALSIFYKEEKQIDKARQTLELALQRINPNDEEIKQRIEELK